MGTPISFLGDHAGVEYGVAVVLPDEKQGYAGQQWGRAHSIKPAIHENHSRPTLAKSNFSSICEKTIRMLTYGAFGNNCLLSYR